MPEGAEGPEDYMPSDNHGSEVVVEKSIRFAGQFFCVFDGMGGGDFGEVASYTAAKDREGIPAVEQHINPCDITPSLTEMCNVINQAVYQAGMNLGSDQTGSTLVGLYSMPVRYGPAILVIAAAICCEAEGCCRYLRIIQMPLLCRRMGSPAVSHI